MAYSVAKKNEDEVNRKLFDYSYFDHPLIFELWNQDFMVRFGLHCPAYLNETARHCSIENQKYCSTVQLYWYLAKDHLR